MIILIDGLFLDYCNRSDQGAFTALSLAFAQWSQNWKDSNARRFPVDPTLGSQCVIHDKTCIYEEMQVRYKSQKRTWVYTVYTFLFEID